MYWNSTPLTMTFPAKVGVYQDEPVCLSIIYTNRNTPVIQTASASAFIRNLKLKRDCCNSYLTTFTDANDQVQPEDMARAFEATIPAFLKQLFGRRVWHFEKETNKCETITATNDEMDPDPGSKALFKIVSLTKDEAVLQLKRKHVDITISLLLTKPRKATTQKNVVLSHAITSHTSLGQFFFSFLRPLFQNIMPTLLKQTVQKAGA